ncbi:MAG: flippase-like domain-containing protein [Tissierellia bacterium]|nr:flippase-like domain-containing protein [Tissierellia bacterium]
MLLVFIIGGISIVKTFKSTDKAAVISAFSSFNPVFLVAAVACFILYLSFESLAYKGLLNRLGENTTFFRSLGYSMSDFLFSSITPGGSGGQPGQFYFMVKDGMSPSNSVFSLFPFNMVYHICLIVIGAIAIITGAMNVIADVNLIKILIIYGLLAQLLMVIWLSLALHSKRVLPIIVKTFFNIARKVPFLKRLANKEAECNEHMEQYKVNGQWLKRNPATALKLAFWIMGMLFFSYSVPYFIYRGLGYAQLNWIQFVLLQGLVVIALESIPIPGGVGVAEHTFTGVYSAITISGGGFALMILTRAVNLYGGMLFGILGIAILALSWNKNDIKLRTRGMVSTNIKTLAS